MPQNDDHNLPAISINLRFSDQMKYIVRQALSLMITSQSKAILFLLNGSADWKRLRNLVENTHRQILAEMESLNSSDSSEHKAEHSDTSDEKYKVHLIVVANREDDLEGATEEGISTIQLGRENSTIYERLNQALLEAISERFVHTKSSIVSLYSAFDEDNIDSISLLKLDEHFERLTIADLKRFEDNVPLDILKSVVDLAIEIGREGREGRAVGTMFVIGDTRKILEESYPVGFDPVKGYADKERLITDVSVRTGIKEIAQLDGAFVISPDGIVKAACRMVSNSVKNITLSKGLGSRHVAGASISKICNAIAVVVSQSSGTVRVFQNGEIVLRIEQINRRPVIWHGFDQ